MNYLDPQTSEYFQKLLIHLEQEESRLHAVASLLTDLATTGTDDPKLRSRMAAAEKLGAALSADRAVPLASIATNLGCSVESITLTRVIAIAPPKVADQMRNTQKRMRLLTRRIERLVATTAVIVGESLRLQHMVLGALFGASSSDRYNARGTQPVENNYATRMESRS